MSRDPEHRHNFLNIWTIFTKFSTNMGNAQMQHIYNFEGSLSILSLLFFAFKCQWSFIIVRFLSKIVGGHLLYHPVGTPNLVAIGWKLKKLPLNIFCRSVLWAAHSVPQTWVALPKSLPHCPVSPPPAKKINVFGFRSNLLGNRPSAHGHYWPGTSLERDDTKLILT